MTKISSGKKIDGDAVRQASNGTGVLRRMRLSDLLSDNDEDRTDFEKFLKPEADTRS